MSHHTYNTGVNIYTLTRIDILAVSEAKSIQTYTFRSKHVIISSFGLTTTKNKGTNTMGITETDNAIACNHGNTCISTTALSIQILDSSKDIFFIDSSKANMVNY